MQGALFLIRYNHAFHKKTALAHGQIIPVHQHFAAKLSFRAHEVNGYLNVDHGAFHQPPYNVLVLAAVY